VIELKIAHNYAKALVSAAKERGMLDEVERALSSVRDLMEFDPAVRRALVETWDSVREKEGAVEEALRGELPDLVVNFLLTVVRRRREGLLPLIFREFERLAAEERGRVFVELRVPMPVWEEDLWEVKRALTEALGREPELAIVVDPELVGGARLSIDSRVLDFSVSRLLSMMARRLARPAQG